MMIGNLYIRICDDEEERRRRMKLEFTKGLPSSSGGPGGIDGAGGGVGFDGGGSMEPSDVELANGDGQLSMRVWTEHNLFEESEMKFDSKMREREVLLRMRERLQAQEQSGSPTRALPSDGAPRGDSYQVVDSARERACAHFTGASPRSFTGGFGSGGTF